MRILFGANNFTGSNIMLGRFASTTNHELKIAAYYRNHQYLNHIDWCLDVLRTSNYHSGNYFQQHYNIPGPIVNHQLATQVIDYLVDWGPELVISDCEPFTATLAKIFEIPLWYCSPMLHLIGLDCKIKNINKTEFSNTYNDLERLPKGNRYLIYSPLCDIDLPLGREIDLISGFEWVKPYYKLDNHKFFSDRGDFSIFDRVDYNFTTGETRLISDCIYQQLKFVITPNLKNPEQFLNARLFDGLSLIQNVGRPQTLLYLQKELEHNSFPLVKIKTKNNKHLDELL